LAGNQILRIYFWQEIISREFILAGNQSLRNYFRGKSKFADFFWWDIKVRRFFCGKSRRIGKSRVNLLPNSCRLVGALKQSDQIGRIFANEEVVYFWPFFKHASSANFWATVFYGASFVHINLD
jgi:hypothetical protein